jgi:hypothetical protein
LVVLALQVRTVVTRAGQRTARPVPAKSGHINGGRLPVHRPYLKLSICKYQDGNDDEPYNPAVCEKLATQQGLQEGGAECVHPACERVHQIGGRASRMRYAVSGDEHSHTQREPRRDKPQGSHGEVVADPAQQYGSDREYSPDEP